MTSKKIWVVASAGGHWVQLLRLTPAWSGHRVCYVTTAPGAEVPPGSQLICVTDANRWDRWNLLRMTLQVLWHLLRERPHVVVTTGAAPGLAAVVLGRLVGARTLWIDSIANSEALSGSGRLARLFASRCITQWNHLASKDQGVGHWGSVL